MNKLLLLLLSFFSIVNGIAQHRISGYIKDATTKEPLYGASIFAPQTTNGGSTDENGLFSIVLKEGQNEILVSYVGYESVIVPAASFSDSEKRQILYLKPNATAIKEIIVKQLSPKERAKYTETFVREFIGLGEIAKSAKLLNPEVLEFTTDEQTKTLTVTANEPLRLINEKTGYAITYELAYFETKAIQEEHHQRLTTYFGYPFFKDIIDEAKLNRKKVLKTREECYKGSTMHFIRSLFNNTTESEGYSVRKFKRELNPDYPSNDSVKKLIERFHKERISFHLPLRFIITYEKGTFKPSQLIHEKDTKKHLYFNDFLSVVYKRAKEESEYTNFYHQQETGFQTSQLRLLNDKPIEIYANGNYSDVDNLATFGYMGWKKTGEMLPFDYVPENEVTD